MKTKTTTRRKKPKLTQLQLFGYPHVAGGSIISEAVDHGGRTYQPCIYCGQPLILRTTGSAEPPAWLPPGSTVGEDCPRQKGRSR